jgi:hypothetical protein
MRLLPVLFGGLLLGAPTLAVAQTPNAQPSRLRGTVEAIQGDALTVTSRNGERLSVALAPDFSVAGVAKASLADIKAGDYVASTSVRGADGKLHALEVHIFPESMRGRNEGQFPWDLAEGSLMTNATVEGVSRAPEGDVLKVAYKGGEAEVHVGPEVPVVSLIPGDRALIKPGVAVFVAVSKGADGKLSAARMTVETEGVKPPM